MSPLLLGCAALGILIAVPLELVALARLRRWRIASGTIYMLLGAFFVILGVAVGMAAASLQTYHRLTREQAAAKVSMHRLGERQFALTLTPSGEPARHFEVRGDEWQIDARVLKWRPIATVAGFDTVYRLERLSGRYASIAQELSAPRTVHALGGEEPFDLWTVARRYNKYVPMVDALYGSAAYVPMAEGADYVVSVSASGLVVRPDNDAARKAVGGWK